MRVTRPGYSREGKDVKLWANYVELAPPKPKEMKLYWYSISAKPKVESKSPGKGEKEAESETAEEDAKLAKGVKLGKIIAQLLEGNLKKNHDKGRLVSDFTATIISLDRLKESSYTVDYHHELNAADTPGEEYIVTVKPAKAGNKKLEAGEQAEVVTEQNMVQDLGPLYKFLTSSDPSDRETSAVATKVPVFMQAMNIWLRHFSKLSKFSPNSSRPVQAIAGSRAFPVPTDKKEIEASKFGESFLLAMGGYFSSARAAAGRLLINVNVSCGAFYQPGFVSELIRKRYFHVDKQTKEKIYEDPNGLDQRKYEYLHRALKGIKVKVTFVEGPRALKTIHGLAHKEVDQAWSNNTNNKTPSDMIAPRFSPGSRQFGASCGQIEIKTPDGWISVYKYLKKGKSLNPNPPHHPRFR